MSEVKSKYKASIKVHSIGLDAALTVAVNDLDQLVIITNSLGETIFGSSLTIERYKAQELKTFLVKRLP